MKKTNYALIGLGILVVLAAIATFIYMSTPKYPPHTADTRAAARDVVMNFGTTLQNVSLVASNNVVQQSIQTSYSPYVAPDLLAAWQKTPSKAPGRLTSSPWPARIDIVSVSELGPSSYAVYGNVVEITSQEMTHGGMADQYEASAVVSYRDGKWLITQWNDSRNAKAISSSSTASSTLK